MNCQDGNASQNRFLLWLRSSEGNSQAQLKGLHGILFWVERVKLRGFAVRLDRSKAEQKERELGMCLGVG